jgi:hypothetical protein
MLVEKNKNYCIDIVKGTNYFRKDDTYYEIEGVGSNVVSFLELPARHL